ncbi:MAG: PilX N-terminal domain-containing pilus assembly protein [Proteobacteria bacterium]|nr:PilX N-terminal domain-containing pilus assembly protein [Pseudomonadota bacterium]
MNRVPQTFNPNGGIRATGAALFVSLVFLFMLTIIGLSGMHNTSLQEKMAGHLREHNLAFQAAESALRSGEVYLATHVLTFVCDGEVDDGLYSNTAPGSTSDCPASSPEKEIFWKDNGDVKRLGETDDQYDNLADKPKYIIEALPSGAVGAGVSLEAGIPIAPGPKYYRITAHGVGVDANAVVITQSVVRQWEVK